MREGWREDPQVGDVIQLRNRPRNKATCSRTIIEVDGDRLLTVGASGRQRDRWMSRSRLRAYDLVSASSRVGSCTCDPPRSAPGTWVAHQPGCPERERRSERQNDAQA